MNNKFIKMILVLDYIIIASVYNLKLYKKTKVNLKGGIFMENASKALIIAGAILLAILIIGLGMFIYNQAADTLGSTDLTGQQVDSYNREFLQYEGVRQGSEVRTLVNNVKAHNRNANDPSEQIQINDIVYDSTNSTVEAPTADITLNDITILSAKTYDVTFAFDPNSGYVTAVGIKEKN